MHSEFPRYVWHKDGDQWYEALLTNEGNGEYHGYPVTSDEVPHQYRNTNDE